MSQAIPRRDFLGSALAGATALGLSSTACGTRDRKPNLIYVFADQLRYQSCGYAGDELAYTPALDRLAGESCNLRQAISNTPVCAAYRSSLLTGKCQSSTGMVINELRLSPEHRCIGHALTDAGYDTGYIGKWHLWANELGGHGKTVNGFVPPGPYRLGFGGHWAAYNFSHIYYNAPYFRDTPDREIWEGYETDSQTEMALDYIRGHAGQPNPFALFLSWGPPHDPWNPENAPSAWNEHYREKTIPHGPNFSLDPDPYADNWGRLTPTYGQDIDGFMRGYYAQTASLDHNITRLLQVLDETGIANDTVFVFTSDHGEMFGAHGRRAKLIFYEEAIRVPFLVRWPGKIQPSESDALLGTPDIMPTLLGLLGIAAPSSAEGSDLSGHLLGRNNRTPEHQVLQGMGATANWNTGHEWRAIRDHQFTYGVYRRDGKELLFDHRADPFQMRDLAGDRAHEAKLRHFREQLNAWRKEHNDIFEESQWYEANWTRDRNIIQTASGVTQDLDALREMQSRYPV